MKLYIDQIEHEFWLDKRGWVFSRDEPPRDAVAKLRRACDGKTHRADDLTLVLLESDQGKVRNEWWIAGLEARHREGAEPRMMTYPYGPLLKANGRPVVGGEIMQPAVVDEAVARVPGFFSPRALLDYAERQDRFTADMERRISDDALELGQDIAAAGAREALSQFRDPFLSPEQRAAFDRKRELDDEIERRRNRAVTDQIRSFYAKHQPWL